MKSLVAGILAAAFLLSGWPDAQTDTAVEFLDTYFQGRFDDAVSAAARIRDAGAVGRAIARDAAPWIDADPRDRDRRRLAVAAFVALFFALSHRPDPGRRHLVVGLTDGEDCGSVVDGAMLLAASGRSEAVLHIIYAKGGGTFSINGVPAWCMPVDPESVSYVTKTAERTGGGVHGALFGDPTVREFRKILDDFRASYVLRYSPRGVARVGWHAVAVAVPAVPDATIRARSGYFVDK